MGERLETSPVGLSLQLIRNSDTLRLYEQGNVKASRKAILPIITQAISEEAPAELGLGN